MNKDQVSIIVPIYNCELYLDRCINSIISQTYDNLDILLINDGSTDNSLKICEKYAKLDNRINVYNLERLGVACARNYGLKKAKGEYIQFIDGDDYIHKDMTKIMVGNMKKTPVDLVICNYIKILKSYKFRSPKMEPSKIYSSIQYLVNTLKDPGHHYYGVVWNKLYKSTHIKNNKITFNNDVTLGEDFIFNLNYLKYALNVKVISRRFYNYNCVGDSLSRNSTKTLDSCREELNNRLIIYDNYIKTFRFFNIYNNYENKILHYWIVFYIHQMYFMEYEAKGWNNADFEIWKQALNEETVIENGVTSISKLSLEIRYTLFKLENYLKNLIKLILKNIYKLK